MSRLIRTSLGRLCAVALPLLAQGAHAASLAPVPPMGFNNWARFQCVPQAPLNGGKQETYSFQQFMTDQGRALYDSGLSAAGYKTVVVDDCWMTRNAAGYLHGNPSWNGSRQPGFDYELTGYVNALHNLGLSVGVYNTAGAKTCQGVRAGAQGHQLADAASYAYWGVDFLKLDNCGSEGGVSTETLDAQMAAALKTVKRPILFDPSLPAAYGPDQPEKYTALALSKKLGQMWRVSGDVRTYKPNDPVDPWDYHRAGDYEEGVYQAYDDTIALSRYMGPDSWNDADQLVVGDNGLTSSEESSQIGLWAIMGAPMILSADVRKLVHPQTAHLQKTLELLSNRQVIAVNQDPLGAGGYRVLRDNPATSAGFDVVVKPLRDGSLAALVLNKNNKAQSYTLKLASLGLAPAANGAYAVSHLWNGRQQTGVTEVTQTLGAHDNMMLRIVGGALTPTGQIQPVQPGFGQAALCLAASGAKAGAGVALNACSASGNQQWQRLANQTIRLAGTSLCLSGDDKPTPGAGGVSLRWAKLAACKAGDAKQAFSYNLTGQLKNGQGCLDVFQGRISTPGTPVNLYQCAPESAPQINQIWSAPHGRTL
ncbi:hypothetical protein CEK28_15260 [Xenophilus sp. AP218F]|nr:hypothetical protein CEK28_15260 [Xenophilus sp. AP218F]